MGREKETEDRIFEAAKAVFHEQGYDGARMQEIADRAGINKSLLHYYYRSKDQLFETVFRASILKLLPEVVGIVQTDLPLLEKVERFVHTYIDLIAANPHLPGFIIHELNRHPRRLRQFVGKRTTGLFSGLSRQIREAAALGEIRPVEPEHFLANLIGLCVFPFLARPMLQAVTGMDEAAYADFLADRKQVVTTFIQNALRP